jgi:DNA-binding SARP family transcriptional activator/tetratricopeptide (TPR) repeat protein
VSRSHDGAVRIEILGPLAAFCKEEEAVLPPGQQLVLGLLALASGAPVSRDALVDMLWQDRPPSSATAIVQTYISRLRRVLTEEVLLRDGPGYRLDVLPEQLDLLEFRQTLDQARTVSGPDEACAAYERALSLWRGDPLAGLPLSAEHPPLVALRAEQVAATLEYADVASANGWHGRVLPYVRALVARHPLDEAAHARLMIALAGTGRQAEALEVLERLRHRLDEELGIMPGPELREAQDRVLRQRVPATGPELPVFQLPAAPADFTGRSAECARLAAAIVVPERVPVVVVSGPPGVGKSALALQVAHQVRAQFPDGQLWVQLAGSSARPRDPSEVLGEFLRALGVHGSSIPESFSERAMCYRSHLADRRILVVADDAATAEQVRPLIPGTAGSALLVTSKSRLEGLDGAHLMPLEVMTAADAAGLLTRMVGQDRMAVDRASADSLVRTCGALPLALRIAGAKLAARPSWPLAVMVRRLAATQDRLRELEVADLSVRSSMASSYQWLSDRGRRAFRLLALLGPCDFAEWVAGALLGEPDSGDVISELTDRSLLIPLGPDATGEPRYRLHDLLRDFATERLAEEPEALRTEALEWLLGGWLQLAQLADMRLIPEPYFPRPLRSSAAEVVPSEAAIRLTADAIAWFSAERVNLLAAVEQACQHGWLPVACRLALHQSAFQHYQCRQDEIERVWRTITDSAEGAGRSAYATLRIGASLVDRGRASEALDILNSAIHAAEEAGELETLAFALYYRGQCAWDMDDHAGAREYAERGLAVARRAGSRLAEMLTLRVLATAHASLGHADRAVAIVEQAAVLAEELGAVPYKLVVQHCLAYVCTLVNQHERAAIVCREAIELSCELGDIASEALMRGILGDAYQGLGRYSDAADSLKRALPALRRDQRQRLHAVCLLKLGYAYEAMGSPEAIGYLEESARIFTELRLPRKADAARLALQRCTVTTVMAPSPRHSPD